MKKHFQSTPAELDRFRCGPLGPHLDSYAHWLSDQGYSHQVGMQKIRLVALLSHWLEQNHIRVQELDEQRIADFQKVRRKHLRRHRQVQHTLTQLLEYLRRSKIIAEPEPLQTQSSIDLLLHDYGQFLAQERGLSQRTLDNYVPVARRFLANSFGAKALHLPGAAVP